MSDIIYKLSVINVAASSLVCAPAMLLM